MAECTDMTSSPSPSTRLSLWMLHLVCLAAVLWVPSRIYDINLTSHPLSMLLLLSVVECPTVILLYGFYRNAPTKCSLFKAAGRGLLGLLGGALVIALGAITLGAPVGIKYLSRTVYWSLLMSSFTFAPAAVVFGSSWADWKRIFIDTRPSGVVDYMICLPAHGAVLGSWFGAWPMPLDWERPWQEWPICVTYGALAGYAIGMVASLIIVLHSSRQHAKEE